jgi:hypothetical protein
VYGARRAANYLSSASRSIAETADCHAPQIPMAKKALAKDVIVKLIVGAGQASPSPPVGPALGSKVRPPQSVHQMTCPVGAAHGMRTSRDITMSMRA